MEKELLYAEKRMDILKDIRKKENNFRLIGNDSFEESYDGTWKHKYQLEKELPKKMEKIYPAYKFSCLKYCTYFLLSGSVPTTEQYSLHFEDDKYIKVVNVEFDAHLNRIELSCQANERSKNGYLSNIANITEEDKLIGEAFYKEVIEEPHIKLRFLLETPQKIYAKN